MLICSHSEEYLTIFHCSVESRNQPLYWYFTK